MRAVLPPLLAVRLSCGSMGVSVSRRCFLLWLADWFLCVGIGCNLSVDLRAQVIVEHRVSVDELFNQSLGLLVGRVWPAARRARAMVDSFDCLGLVGHE